MADKKRNKIFFIPSEGKIKVPSFSHRQIEGEYFSDLDEKDITIPVKKTGVLSVFLYSVLIAVFLVIFFRVFYLQVLNYEQFDFLSERNRIKTERIVASRGFIYDRNMNVLADNEYFFSLKIITKQLSKDTDREKFVERLLEIVSDDSYYQEDKEKVDKIMADILTDKISEPVITVLDKIDYETAVKIKLEDDLSGVLLDRNLQRKYKNDFYSLAHILGYTGRMTEEEWNEYKNKGYYFGDYIGKTGLEKKYEAILKGTDSLVQIETDIKQNISKIISKDELVPGNNLVLSIDFDMQKKLYEILKKYTDKYSGKGAGVIIDPLSGKILSLVSIPDFNNNDFILRNNDALRQYFTNPDRPLFNRVVSGTYPPGSTFKPVVAVSALNEGIVSSRTTFLSTGGIRVGSWFFPDWKDGGHGVVNLYKAIAESVNTYFYYIGGGYEDFKGLGVERIVKYAKMFGFGKKLGIDLPSEATGFLPSKKWKEEAKGERWYVGDTYHLSIGQGDILVTPLQLAYATAVFANGGILYKPEIVSLISNSKGQIIEEVKPEILNSGFIPLKYIQQVRRAYRETVLSGSGISLLSLPVTSAGKTGTAQVGGDRSPHAWFVGWAPYENPEILMVVLVENGEGGNSSALPVFREFVSWWSGVDK